MSVRALSYIHEAIMESHDRGRFTRFPCHGTTHDVNDGGLCGRARLAVESWEAMEVLMRRKMSQGRKLGAMIVRS